MKSAGMTTPLGKATSMSLRVFAFNAARLFRRERTAIAVARTQGCIVVCALDDGLTRADDGLLAWIQSQCLELQVDKKERPRQ